VGLLLGADRKDRSAAVSAGAQQQRQRSAANAGSVMLTAE